MGGTDVRNKIRVQGKPAIRTPRQYDCKEFPLRLVIYGFFVEALFLWACLSLSSTSHSFKLKIPSRRRGTTITQ